MKRFAVAVLMALLLAPSPLLAQDPPPTAVVVTPPTSEGCDRIGDYVATLEQISDTMRERLSEAFPNTTPIEQMADDEWGTFLASMTPDELRTFAAVFDEIVVLMESMGVPSIAEPYHHERVIGMRLWANLLREGSTGGLFMSALLYGDMIDASSARLDALGQATLLVCPAFQDVLDLYADGDLAPTPEPTVSRPAHRLDGTITLIGDAVSAPRIPTFQQPSGRCQGAGRYIDVQSLTIATLSDGNGQLLGYGTLGEGWYERGANGDLRCKFTFFISQVPAEDEYTIAFGDELFTYTYHDLELVNWAVSLELR